MPRKPEVVSRWNKFYENFRTSSLDFYLAVEDAIDQRELPDVKCSRVRWKESGVLSAKREYLRITHGKLHLDICAAPFGRGFFFSSRLAHLPSTLAGFVYFALFSAASYFLLKLVGHDGDVAPLFQPWITLTHDVPIVFAFFFVVGALVRLGVVGNEEAVLSMPIFGYLYEKLFNPETYFKEDTEQILWESVNAAVQHTIDAVTSGKIIRVLPEVPEAAGSETDEWDEAAEPVAG
jgi:hypothetical protein